MSGRQLHPRDYRRILDLALEEDLGGGDLTAEACIPAERCIMGRLVAKESFVLCGLDVAKAAFLELDPDCEFPFSANDGDAVQPGDELLRVKGRARALLGAERVALNFLQRLSGVATVTSRYVDALKGSSVSVVDTRKTTPGLRTLEKYAVHVGGGRNHRTGLFDGVLIKENHIRSAGSIALAVSAAREHVHHLAAVEVEVTNLDELDQALQARAEVVMLDNFSPERIAEAVQQVNGRAKIEVSGGVTLERLADLALAGVDYISVGALTHSAPAVDISMLFEQ